MSLKFLIHNDKKDNILILTNKILINIKKYEIIIIYNNNKKS